MEGKGGHLVKEEEQATLWHLQEDATYLEDSSHLDASPSKKTTSPNQKKFRRTQDLQ